VGVRIVDPGQPAERLDRALGAAGHPEPDPGDEQAPRVPGVRFEDALEEPGVVRAGVQAGDREVDLRLVPVRGSGEGRPEVRDRLRGAAALDRHEPGVHGGDGVVRRPRLPAAGAGDEDEEDRDRAHVRHRI